MQNSRNTTLLLDCHCNDNWHHHHHLWYYQVAEEIFPPELIKRHIKKEVKKLILKQIHNADYQKTPLHHAVMNDDVFNLTKLLDDGADPNAQVLRKGFFLLLMDLGAVHILCQQFWGFPTPSPSSAIA